MWPNCGEREKKREGEVISLSAKREANIIHSKPKGEAQKIHVQNNKDPAADLPNQNLEARYLLGEGTRRPR